MELIRRHYVRLGGAARLGWLMESPDREVRLFAVRLLWERHRPRHLPPGWKPATKSASLTAEGAAAGEAGSEQFGDIEALRADTARWQQQHAERCSHWLAWACSWGWMLMGSRTWGWAGFRGTTTA